MVAKACLFRPDVGLRCLRAPLVLSPWCVSFSGHSTMRILVTINGVAIGFEPLQPLERRKNY
jgi:hypothetical protein